MQPPESARLPGPPPEYLEVYLRDNPPAAKAPRLGHGHRMVLTLDVGRTRSRVMVLPTLTVGWIPSDWLRGGKPHGTHGLMTFIRTRRAERHRQGMAVSEQAACDALELLAGKRVPTRTEEEDEDAGQEADSSMSSDVNQPGAAALPPAPGTTQEVADVNTVAAGSEGKPKGKRAAAKKAAPKGKAKKSVKSVKAAAPKRDTAATAAAREAQTLKVKASAVDKYREGTPGKVAFALLKDGMTVGDFIKKAEAKGIDRGKANTLIRVFRNDGVLTVK